MQRRTVRATKVNHDVDKIITEAIIDSGIRRKQRVFIKPNISHPEFVPGVVTDPIILQQVVGLLRDKCSEVVVGESDGFNYSCTSAFRNTGIESAVKAAGGEVVNLSEDKLVRIKFQGAHRCPKELFLPKTVLEADGVVDIALMKTHEFTKFSGAIKNLFGCIPDRRRIFLHPYMKEVFHALYRIISPDLTIMDARVALEGNGPTKGDPVDMNLILTSDDALSLDLVASRVMGLKLDETGYLSYMAEKESMKFESVTVAGVQVQGIMRKFKLPTIDLPVKAQMEIYKHEYLTKVFFCSQPIVKLFQKLTIAYRGKPIENQLA